MKSDLKPVFLIMALLLHAVLIAAVYATLADKQSPLLRPPLTVSLIPPQGTSAKTVPAQVPAQPPPLQPEPLPAPKAAEKSVPARKRAAKRPAARRPASEASDTTFSTPAPATQPSDMTASATDAVPPSAPAAPVKTDVSIPASYAATNREPEYPSLSRRYGEQGTVLLRVLVKEDGTVGKIELKASSGFPLLDKSAMNAVKDWRFNPATVDGKPVAEWYQVPIPFKLKK